MYQTKKSNRNVTFSNKIDVIYEDPDISKDLKLARIGDFLSKKADKLRTERLLNPVFSPAHRARMEKIVELSEKWLKDRQLDGEQNLSFEMSKLKSLLANDKK